MKKIYSFIALMLLLFVGNAQAQRAWDLSADMATEISTDKYYVIQEGSYTGWSASEFISVNGMVAEVNTPAVFQFVEAGEKECESGNVYPLYYLRSVENGMYLSSGDQRWVKGKTNAWKFSARIAEDKDLADDATWEDWSNAILGIHDNGENRNANSDGIAFVFTEDNDESTIFMNYVGEPGFASYWDTNDFFVYEVVEREISEYEKFVIFFNDAFPNMVDTQNFPIGSNPGCISEEVFMLLEEAYNLGVELCADDTQSDEVYLAARTQIEAALKAYAEGVIPVAPGYYALINQRSQDPLQDNGSNVVCSNGAGVPAEWTAETAKYIWVVEESDQEGRYYYRNFKTNRYIGRLQWQSSGNTPMTKEPEETYVAYKIIGQYFGLNDEAGNGAHNAGNGALVAWNSTGTGNQWQFVTVDAEAIARLEGEVQQALLYAELQKVVDDAKALEVRYKLKNGLTYDDMYLSDGLVDADHMLTNSPENGEGYAVEDQFKRIMDGNLTTYFHTSWSEEAPADDWHWVQVDLGKELEKVTVKFSQRHNNRNGNPSKIAFVTCEDVASAVWDDTLTHDTVIYQYATNFPAGRIDSTTAVMEVNFGKPVQHVRLAVTRTKANQIYGGGPCWHVSELRFYEDLGPNPLYDMIPQAVKDELAAAIAAGDKEISVDSLATQATIDRINAAMEAFQEAYPDPAGLQSLIEEAEAQMEAAEEGEEMGTFKTGAKATLQTTVDAVKAATDGKDLNLEELTKYENQMKDALKQFANSLIKPAPGIYRIISTSINEETGEDRPQTGSYVYAANADVNTSPMWGYKASEDDVYETRWNMLWEVTANEAGELAFRNLATGRYIGNQFEGLDAKQANELINKEGRDLIFSEKPVYFAMQSDKHGAFNIVLCENQYMNFDPRKVLVGYGVANDVNARITFEEVTELADEYFSISVTANKVNAITLPYDVLDLYGSTLQLAGRAEEAVTDEDGITTYELYLVANEEETVIPAGTPFFYAADAEETYLDLNHPTVTDLDALVEMAISYEGKIQNGVLGVNATFEVEPGVGLLNGNQILVAEEGDEVTAGSVIFGGAEDIPVYEGSADDATAVLLLPVEVVSGKLNTTGIESVVVAKKAAKGVYAISGVKVRNNNNVNGLPKGLYIVGGKKVIVK